MVSAINESFMKFQKRAEASDAATLVETFVDVGPLMTLLSNTDHQVIYGRRGTGKTHAFSYLGQQRRKEGEVDVYIDLRTVGSTAGVYNDPNLPLSERATRLLIDVLLALHDELLQFGIECLPQQMQNPAGAALDRLGDATKDVRVIGTVEKSEATLSESSSKESAGGSVSISSKPAVSIKGETTSGQTVRSDRSVKRTGEERHRVNFGATMDALTGIVAAFGGRRIWLLLDEWSAVAPELQPFLADLIRRAMLPIKGMTVKIAAIEQRSRFRIPLPDRGYIGIELGADMAADINLDDFMVFDIEQTRARAFFSTLVFKHYRATVSADAGFKSAPALIQDGFTQINAFDEFVRASEGVPRDAINILSLAAQRALDSSISIQHVRVAARDWYQRDKENTGNDRARSLLNWIIDEVISHRRARAFLLQSGTFHPLIDDLFDARVLHLLKRNISSKDQPGVRFDVYKLDYGCYVDLINTQKAPDGLLPQDDGAYVDVPPDDYRSIRNAVLELNMFEAAEAAHPIASSDG